MTFELGIVVASYPQGQSVDVLLASDGSRLSNVQVMVPTGSSDSGTVDLPDIGAPVGEDRWIITGPVDRYVRAVIGTISGVPVCMGFLLPQITQMTFDQKNRHIHRHPSDVYSTIDGAGNLETYHPSGTYFRIGASGAHEDLTGQDYDKQWAIAKNTGAAVHAHLSVANAGTVVATVDIDPSGNINIQNNGNLTATVGGNMLATVSGTTSINSTGNAEVTAPTITLNGTNIVLNGSTLINGPLAQGTGSGGGSATLLGPLTVTNDVTAEGTSLHTHRHTSTTPGTPTTPPI